jgi:hypothetical protein
VARYISSRSASPGAPEATADIPTVEIKTNRTTAREARLGRMANPFDSVDEQGRDG